MAPEGSRFRPRGLADPAALRHPPGMSRTCALWAALALFVVLAPSCTDDCDRAIEVLDRQCGIVVDRDPGEACEGEMSVVSRCIIDFPYDACDYYYDPVAEADNPFARCAFAE